MKASILAVVVVLSVAGPVEAKAPRRAHAPAAAPSVKRMHVGHPHERPDDTATRVINFIAGVLMVGVTGIIARTSKEMLDQCAAHAMLPARG